MWHIVLNNRFRHFFSLLLIIVVQVRTQFCEMYLTRKINTSQLNIYLFFFFFLYKKYFSFFKSNGLWLKGNRLSIFCEVDLNVFIPLIICPLLFYILLTWFFCSLFCFRSNLLILRTFQFHVNCCFAFDLLVFSIFIFLV